MKAAAWVYGILIHSCYVDDGHGNKFDLLDHQGLVVDGASAGCVRKKSASYEDTHFRCAIDRYLLADVVYEEKSLGAFANTVVTACETLRI